MNKKASGALTKKASAKFDLAASVSQRAELESILLVDTVARRKSLLGEHSANVTVGANVGVHEDRKLGVIQVRPHFVLIARFEEGGDDEFLRIEATFLLQYRLPSCKGLRKANIAAFGETTGLHNAWPYWREFVQATTVRMGFPVLTVPLYKPLAGKAPRSSVSSQPKTGPKRARKRRPASVAT